MPHSLCVRACCALIRCAPLMIARAGMAVGVGSSRILGRIHQAPLKVWVPCMV
jgi:Aspartyl protease